MFDFMPERLSGIVNKYNLHIFIVIYTKYVFIDDSKNVVCPQFLEWQESVERGMKACAHAPSAVQAGRLNDFDERRRQVSAPSTLLSDLLERREERRIGKRSYL